MPTLEFSSQVHGSPEGRVLFVTLDNPPVNAASQTVRAGLLAAVARLEQDPDLDAMVITGMGKVFIGGADIREFGQPPLDPILPVVVERIEQARKPIVAAINGAALGGGLEVALACHARLASPAAKLGLPEVKLGLVPGAGGTQRLPRLTGLLSAIDMIGTGRIVSAQEALALGIVDAVSGADLKAEALAEAASLSGRPIRRTGELPVPPALDADLDAAGQRVLAKAKRQKAPVEAVRLVTASATLSLKEGLAQERQTFLSLKDGDEARALRHVFFAERDAAKVEGLDGAQARPLETIGIAGTGLMGSGIAVAALSAGFAVVAVDQTEEAAAAGRSRIEAILQRNLTAGRVDAATHAAQLSRLLVSHRLETVAACDLVIEAVFDDFDVKATLFRRLDDVVRPDAVLATNTSYLDPDKLAAETRDPSRVVGLHFFSPANIMRLAEVVRGAQTAPDVLATGLAFAKRLGKLPIVCGVTEGFIGNRVFSAYRKAAEFLVEDGASPDQVDRAMEAFGMAMGPFAVFDLAGLEIAWARRKRQASARNPAERYCDIADRLCEVGRFGQKVGKGWYAYDDGKRRVDPDVTSLIESVRHEKNIVPRQVSEEEIVARLVEAMAREGQALLDEGVAARPGDVDLVLINGYGFPAHRGGPMFMSAGRPLSG